jgi:hypothetical protein
VLEYEKLLMAFARRSAEKFFGWALRRRFRCGRGLPEYWTGGGGLPWGICPLFVGRRKISYFFLAPLINCPKNTIYILDQA